jgi:hypothetical protein
MVANVDGSGARALATRRAPEVFSPIYFAAPAWSPDGRVLVTSLETRGDRPRATLVAFRSSDGVEQPFPRPEWASGGHVVWTPDGSGVVAVAADRTGRPHQLWWVGLQGGAPRAITNDLSDYRKVPAQIVSSRHAALPPRRHPAREEPEPEPEPVRVRETPAPAHRPGESSQATQRFVERALRNYEHPRHARHPRN